VIVCVCVRKVGRLLAKNKHENKVLYLLWGLFHVVLQISVALESSSFLCWFHGNIKFGTQLQMNNVEAVCLSSPSTFGSFNLHFSFRFYGQFKRKVQPKQKQKNKHNKFLFFPHPLFSIVMSFNPRSIAVKMTKLCHPVPQTKREEEGIKGGMEWWRGVEVCEWSQKQRVESNL